MKRSLLYSLLILVFVMTACQPTPDKDIVVPKDGSVEKQVAASPAPQARYESPAICNESFEGGNKLSVRIQNAAVVVPDVQKCPVYSVDPALFTPEQVRTLMPSLFGDAAVFYAGDADNQRFDGSFTGSELHVYAYLDDPKPASLDLQNQIHNSAWLRFSNGNEYWASGSTEKQAKGILLGPAAAAESVAQWLAAVGIADMRIAYCQTGGAYQSVDTLMCEGYVINCARYIENIPVTYNVDALMSSSSFGEKADFSRQLFRERLIFTVDDTGITGILWENPIRVTLVNENIQLLPFNELIQKFKQSIKNKFAWVADADSVEGATPAVTLMIDEIRLGFAIMPAKDMDGYLLVPAWDFFGTQTNRYADGREDEEMLFRDRSFISINAIDGSIIG